MARKTSIKKSTRAKAELRIAQQKAAADQKAGRGAFAKKRAKIGGQLTAKEGQALQRAAAAKPKAKKKSARTVSGVAGLLRSRGKLPK